MADASSSTGPNGSGPIVPERTYSKRPRIDLKNDLDRLKFHLMLAKEAVRCAARSLNSFDAQYWTSAADACEASVHCLHAEAILAVHDWVETEYESAESWWQTEEARRIFEQTKAAMLERVLYRKHVERVKAGGPIRRTFNTMFTASELGICAEKVEMVARKRSEQSKFKEDLIRYYDAGRYDLKRSTKIVAVHDTATGLEHDKDVVTAVPLFPYKFVPNVLVSLFGEDVDGELMTALNGLLIHYRVKEAMYDGSIAIVPDLPDDPTAEQVAEWERAEPKDYRWCIIDENAESLDNSIAFEPQVMIVRDLDGRKLSFKNDNRPRDRYLQFLFVVAQLNMAWSILTEMKVWIAEGYGAGRCVGY